MAVREIRIYPDPILGKKCREVKRMTMLLRVLINDMIETMYEADGVGLAAPQVGVLKRVVVIDTGEEPLVMINPRILETSGEEIDTEGCLSVPDKGGDVARPTYVKAEALDENMQPYEIEAEGLMARAICHEVDHLDGIVYVEKVIGELYDVSYDEEDVSMKKVVFMGTPDFAAGILQALYDHDYEIAAVFTQPDKPKGRKAVLTPSPVKVLAMEHGTPVYQPKKIREEENLHILEEIGPDVIIAAAFGQIIPQSILDLPAFGCINVHASLLPAYRGASPIQHAILAGETKTGVTIMRMNAGLDTGDMIRKTEVEIMPDETGGSLFDKLSRAGAELLIETLPQIADGTAVYEKQPEESPTPYASMLKRADGEIDWNTSAVQIERKIRAMDPWPGTYTRLDGKTLKIWKAEVYGDSCGFEPSKPGTAVSSDHGRILIQTGDGILSVTELQPEGKKRMDSAAYLRGYALIPGTVLG